MSAAQMARRCRAQRQPELRRGQGGPSLTPSPPSRPNGPRFQVRHHLSLGRRQRLADHLVDPAGGERVAVAALSPVSSTAEPEPAQLGHGRGGEPLTVSVTASAPRITSSS